MMARRSQPYRHAHLSNSSCLFPMLCVLAHRHLSWASNEANLLAGVSGIPSCCPSGTLLLTCNPSPGSGHLLVALALVGWTQVPVPQQPYLFPMLASIWCITQAGFVIKHSLPWACISCLTEYEVSFSILFVCWDSLVMPVFGIKEDGWEKCCTGNLCNGKPQICWRDIKNLTTVFCLVIRIVLVSCNSSQN